MAWTCPTCKRTFLRNKQWHSCEEHDIENIFADKPLRIRQLYEALLGEVLKIGPMEVHVSRWNITLRHNSTFMAVVPDKSTLVITFIREEALDDFPVYQTHHYSKNRWSNHVKIESKEEIDRQLLNWLKEAYDMAI